VGPQVLVVDDFFEATAVADAVTQILAIPENYRGSSATVSVNARLAEKLASPICAALKRSGNDKVVLPAARMRGDVAWHYDRHVLADGSPFARGHVAVVYLSGGGSLEFADGRRVEVKPGRLVAWNAEAAHCFCATPGESRMIIGPVALRFGELQAAMSAGGLGWPGMCMYAYMLTCIHA
jgi:hypothetical protein